MELELDPNDVISATAQQRNAAMDEITRQAAIIKALQRKLEEREKQTELPLPLVP